MRILVPMEYTTRFWSMLNPFTGCEFAIKGCKFDIRGCEIAIRGCELFIGGCELADLSLAGGARDENLGAHGVHHLVLIDVEPVQRV
jgi:hypothetical protein